MKDCLVKTLSRTFAASLATVSLLALAGCSDDAKPEPPTPTPSASASATNTPVETASPTNSPVPTPTFSVDPTTGDMDFCDPKKQEPFTGPATEEFGAEAVMDAYCQMVDVEMQYSFLDPLMRADSGFEVRDFSIPQVRDMMLPELQKFYDDSVKAVVDGNATDQQAGAVRTFFGYWMYNGSGYTLDTPGVYGTSFTPATTRVETVEGRKFLILSFSVKTKFALLRDSDNKEMAQEYTKDLVFRLEQGTVNSTYPWYVHSYSMTLKLGEKKPRAQVIKYAEQTPEGEVAEDDSTE